MLPQCRARPLPHAAELGLAGQAAVRRHGDGVPVLEADVGTGEVDEEAVVGTWPRAVFVD